MSRVWGCDRDRACRDWRVMFAPRAPGRRALDGCRKVGCQLVVDSCDENEAEEIEAARRLVSDKVEGVILPAPLSEFGCFATTSWSTKGSLDHYAALRTMFVKCSRVMNVESASRISTISRPGISSKRMRWTRLPQSSEV